MKKLSKSEIGNQADYLCGHVVSFSSAVLECGRCGATREASSIGIWAFAEASVKKGWRVTQRGVVVCPVCDQKRA